MEDLTYGQKLVGLKFNPSELTQVDELKQHAADIIDNLYLTIENSTDDIQIELAQEAIKQCITSQMWAIKAVTWKM